MTGEDAWVVTTVLGPVQVETDAGDPTRPDDTRELAYDRVGSARCSNTAPLGSDEYDLIGSGGGWRAWIEPPLTRD
jgi:hypothetical protein